MALSQAAKKRRARLRTTGKDVTKARGTASMSLHERTTLTKQGKERKQFTKHKRHSLKYYDERNAFSIIIDKSFDVAGTVLQSRAFVNNRIAHSPHPFGVLYSLHYHRVCEAQ